MKSYSIFLTALIVAVSCSISGEESCEQEFVLFDKTVGKYSLMFYRVDWAGDCSPGRSSFYTLFILPDRVHSSSSTSLRGNWVPRLFKNMEIEAYEILIESGGRYYLDDTTFFSAPKHNSFSENKFNSLPKKNVKTWHWECVSDCVVLPEFHNFDPEPIYYHPEGLYINYTFSEVRYYRESNYLILLTNQSLLDEDRRTMNGMIILSVNGYQW